MQAYFLFFAIFVNMILQKALVKRCSNSVSRDSMAEQALFLILNGITACLFFFILGGFRLSFNRETALFALAFATVCAASVLSSLAAYKLSSITGVSIIAGTCSTVTTALIGCLFFSETATLRKLLRILILLSACALVFLNGRTEQTKQEKGPLPKGDHARFAIVLLGLVFAGCGAVVVSKRFAMSETVTDENSYFFLTNAIMVAISAVVFGIRAFGNPREVKASFALLKPNNILSIILNTATSNISSILSIWVVAIVDISIYSPINQALGVISAVLASFLFKEKQGKLLIIAAAMACVAVII